MAAKKMSLKSGDDQSGGTVAASPSLQAHEEAFSMSDDPPMNPLETLVRQALKQSESALQKSEILINRLGSIIMEKDELSLRVERLANQLTGGGALAPDVAAAVQRLSTADAHMNAIDQRLQSLAADFDAVGGRIAESVLGGELTLEKVAKAVRMADDLEEKVARLAGPLDEVGLLAASFDEVPPVGDLGYSLNDLLLVMMKHGASDLHIKMGVPPIVRLDGDLFPVGAQPLTEQHCRHLIFSALTRPQRRRLMEHREVDCAYTMPEGRFRVNAFLQKGSLSAAFRHVRLTIPTMEEMALPPVLKKLAGLNNGLILVTGPTGSGKSTTLASMIDFINANRNVHIVTIEDPIEFIHADKTGLVTQREVGVDTPSFGEALRHALRQDPDVILIGEMRDAETMMTAVTAAETGHLVLSTMHTPNAIQAVDRIIDMFSGDQQLQFRQLLASSLRAVVSQRLMARADGAGRIATVEVLVVTPTIASLILENKIGDIYPLMVSGAHEGMQTFTQSLIKLYEQGLITREEGLFHADQPTEFRLGIEGHTTGTSTMGEDTLISWL